jgi:serine phosphatase RsbU (regulator of sigma subunit)
VVGHGIEAAAKMVVVRSALKAVTQLGTPVEDIFSLAEPLIHGPAKTFIGTAVVLLVDPARQRLSYTSAGHPPAVLIRPDGCSQLLDEANGIVLGCRDREPRAATVPFPPGALVIAYTDGLVESRSAGIDSGIERLRAAATEGSRAGLHADELVGRLVASAGGLDDRADDIAIVVLRHRSEAAAT